MPIRFDIAAQADATGSEVPIWGLLALIFLSLLMMAGFVFLCLLLIRRRLQKMQRLTGREEAPLGLGDVLKHGPEVALYGKKERDLGWLTPPKAFRFSWRARVMRREAEGSRYLVLALRAAGRRSDRAFVVRFTEFADFIEALERAIRGEPLDGADEPPPPVPGEVEGPGGIFGAPEGRYLGDLNRVHGDTRPVHVYHDADALTLVSTFRSKGRHDHNRSQLLVSTAKVLLLRLAECADVAARTPSAHRCP